MGKVGVEDVSIRKRLNKSFLRVSGVVSVAAIVGLLAMLFVGNRYQRAMTYYAFPQGDIGKAMTEFAEARSSLRAAIGYDDIKIIEEQKKLHDEHRVAFTQHLKDIEKTMISEEGKAAFAAIEASLEGYWELDTEIMEQGAVTDREECEKAQLRAINELMPKYDAVELALSHLMDINVEKGEETRASLYILGWVVATIIVTFIIGSIALANKMGRKVAKTIEKPVRELEERLEAFADGDIFSPFPENNSGDEISMMVKAAAKMAEVQKVVFGDVDTILTEMGNGNFAVKTKMENAYVGDFRRLLLSIRKLKGQMNETLLQVGEASSQVSSGSENLANSAQALAEGAMEQAGAVEELTASITSITQDVENTAKNLQETQKQASEYAQDAEKSRAEMESLVEAMNRINETSKKIEHIISDIEDIASQTNLLSLNASIEAARAGEAGRGFAVVADQIGKLAEQSAHSAVQTRQLIEDSVREVEEGNKAAHSAAKALEGVVSGIKEIAEVSAELSRNSSDQALAMEQAEIGVNQIADVVQSNSATAQETSATSEELSAQAISLNQLIENFTLTKEH